MSKQNIVTRFFQIIGAAMLLLVINPTLSFADSGSSSSDFLSSPVKLSPFSSQTSFRQVSSEEDDASSEQALAGSNVILRDLSVNLNLSFGVERTLNRGKEANRDVYYTFASAEFMWHVTNFGPAGAKHTRLEAGFTIGGSPQGEYKGSEGPDANMSSGDNRYSSVFRNFRLGGKVVLRDIGGSGKPALWELSLNPWVGYNYDRGSVGHNDPFRYRSKAVTYTLGLRAQAALLFPVYGLGTQVQRTLIRGEATPVLNGFLPRIELVAEYENAFSTKRRTTVTRQGGSDRQRNISYMGRLRVHLWRFNNETADINDEWLFELDPVVIGHFEGRTRYGFAQVRNDNFSNRLGGGFGLHLTINKTAYVQVEGVVKKAFDNFTLGRGSDEVLGEVQLNLGFSF